MKPKKHKNIENIINQWLMDHNIREVIVSFEVYGRYIYIYSDYPGILIGYHGECVNDLIKRLKENKINKKVNFIEIGRFVREIRVKRKWF